MAGTYSCLINHIIFSTKHRRPLIVPDLRPRLYDYIGGIIRKHQGTLYEIGGMPDHLHLLLRMHQDMPVSDLVRDIKSSSSGWIHQTFEKMHEFQWQDGYGVFSASKSQMNRIKSYIQGQATHHQICRPCRGLDTCRPLPGVPVGHPRLQPDGPIGPRTRTRMNDIVE